MSHPPFTLQLISINCSSVTVILFVFFLQMDADELLPPSPEENDSQRRKEDYSLYLKYLWFTTQKYSDTEAPALSAVPASVRQQLTLSPVQVIPPQCLSQQHMWCRREHHVSLRTCWREQDLALLNTLSSDAANSQCVGVSSLNSGLIFFWSFLLKIQITL